MENGTLYLATDDAGEGMDAFIFLADELGGTVGSPWAKSGQVAGWDAFLADENDNDYSGWFDTGASVLNATGANGGVLEGVIDLDGEFGSLPIDLYLASALYTTADGGSLVPSGLVGGSSNGDLNLDAAEYLKLTLAALIGSPEALGDLDGDGAADLDDLAFFLLGAGTVSGDANMDQGVNTADLAILAGHFDSAVDSYAQGDFNLDGVVGTADLAILAGAFDVNFAGTAASAAVPEPGTLVLVSLGAAAVARRRYAA
ncbi:MAG: PEP-CTERM sorting domain-containing protein, partial [Planctomycetota bacterium]